MEFLDLLVLWMSQLWLFLGSPLFAHGRIVVPAPGLISDLEDDKTNITPTAARPWNKNAARSELSIGEDFRRHVAIVGQAESGKSSCIDSLRGIGDSRVARDTAKATPNHEARAMAGQPTSTQQRYAAPFGSLWDTVGFDETTDADGFVRKNRLIAYDDLLIFCWHRSLETAVAVAVATARAGVRVSLVWCRTDELIQDRAREQNKSSVEVKDCLGDKLRDALNSAVRRTEGPATACRVYVISNRVVERMVNGTFDGVVMDFELDERRFVGDLLGPAALVAFDRAKQAARTMPLPSSCPCCPHCRQEEEAYNLVAPDIHGQPLPLEGRFEPQAKEVFLVGSFTDWEAVKLEKSRTRVDAWQGVFDLLRDEPNRYYFVVDGVRRIDPTLLQEKVLYNYVAEEPPLRVL